MEKNVSRNMLLEIYCWQHVYLISNGRKNLKIVKKESEIPSFTHMSPNNLD